jgi:hypothetical protein
MRSTERRAGLWQILCGALLGLYLSAPAYAFTPSDSPLLSAAAVAPNVMLLIDDSGSMNNIIYPRVQRVPRLMPEFVCDHGGFDFSLQPGHVRLYERLQRFLQQ